MENKKIAAAMSAVMLYIKTQEEMAMQAAPVETAEEEIPKPVSLNLWGLSGRQDQMQMRSYMQMKSFHGSKPGIG